MKPTSAQPLVGPAVAIAAGTWLAFQLSHLPMAALGILTIVCLANGKAPARLIAWGALAAGLTLARGLPNASIPQTRIRSPVVAELMIMGHPRYQDERVSAWVRIERLRQGNEVQRTVTEALLTAPWDGRPLAWHPGTRVRARGYLRPAAVYRNGGFDRRPSWRFALPSLRLVEATTKAPWHGRIAATLRRRIETAWAGQGGERPSQRLAIALLLGDPSRLPTSWVQALRRVGLGHVLAVSGLHLALALGFVMTASWWLPRRPRLLLGLSAAGAYMALVGTRPSVDRAAWMAAAALVALALARPPVAQSALAISVLALVLRHPSTVVQLAFQLTVAATASIIIVVPRWQGRGPAGRSPIRSSLAVALAAQLGTAPISLPAFSWFSTAAIPANLLAIPWLTLTMAIYGLATVVGCLRPDAGVPWLSALDGLAIPLSWLTELPAGPWLGFPMTASPGVALIGALAAGAVLLGRGHSRLAGLLAVLVLAGHGPSPRTPEMILLDVGQGDAILLRDGSHTWLVDGGGWPRGDLGGRVLVPALAGLGVRRLDGVWLTHADRDHCRGLVDLARYVRIGTVMSSRHAREQPCGAELVRRVASQGDVAVGTVVTAGRWRMTVLASGDEAVAAGLGSNDRSTVIMAEVHGRRILLTGDIEAATELRLAASDVDLAGDVLKVAHHGSRTSTSRRFLDRVAPRWALISAGRRNPFGHPTAEVIDRLHARGVRVLRTDRHGAVGIAVAENGNLIPRWIGLGSSVP